jgi:Protein of unknown function (DUF3306)
MARDDKEPFLSRWSRRKLEEARAPDPAPPPARPAETAPPELPPIDQLSFDSNYKDFLHPKVDETLRRQALKKLFASAHFQTPDMMDDFNEDYTKLLEPLAPGIAEKLAHAKRTLLRGEPEAPQAQPAQGAAVAPAAAAAPEGATTDASRDIAQAETPPAEPAKDDDGAAG